MFRHRGLTPDAEDGTMNFYQQLPSFDHFPDITRNDHFVETPSDWWIMVADIQGSTEAVEAGRYKDVNTLGAAAITAVQNLLGEGTFPYVFGGDGASLVIPPESATAAKHQLAALRTLAREQFGMHMRVGAMPVSALDGTRVEVAKHRLAGRKSLAVFRGGGLSQAEDMIKNSEGRHEIPDADGVTADLGGLSCRWQPIKAKQDYALSLLIRSRDGDSVYEHVLDGLTALYGGNLDLANPIHIGGAQYRTIRDCLNDELRYHRSRWSLKFAWRTVEIVCAVMIFGHGMPAPFRARNYVQSLGRHSDYRKFDDMLRMVIDCSEHQLEQIRSMLQTLQQQGKLDYGMHLAKESLMTCFFHGPNEGEHIHFVDGADGGYAMAAKQLKSQMSARD